MSYTKFAIVAQPRTGSTLLHMRLISHDGIIAFGEMFHPAEETRRRNVKNTNRPMMTLADDPIAYLNQYVYKSYPRLQAAGFKLFYTHARNPEWQAVWSYLRDEGIRILHLTRRNMLNSFLSLKLAQRTNQWVVFDKEAAEREKAKPIVLQADELLDYFHTTRSEEERVNSFFTQDQLLPVVYEDLVDSPEQESERVQRFLQVTPQPLKTRTHKQQTRRQSEAIQNYVALKQTVSEAVRQGEADSAWLSHFRD